MGLADVLVIVNRMQADGVIGRYALGGAVAATFYLEPVATVDVDVFVTFPSREGSRLLSSQPILEYLTARGHAIDGEYVVISGWPTMRDGSSLSSRARSARVCSGRSPSDTISSMPGGRS